MIASRKRNATHELNNLIEKHIQELAKATDTARTSQEMLSYLDFCSRFHHYSPSNIWLIMLARPKATHVAGYHKWKSMDRWVKKGESGIPILAPMLIKEELEDGHEAKRLVGFKVVYVFDVTQTEGESLPEPPNWKSPEKNHELNLRLLEYAKNQGISVTFKNLPGEIQGLSKGGSIDIDYTAGTKTLVHEIAHELLHRGKTNLQSKAIKELEAESVAYVVCKHFGIKGLNSSNYLALFEVSIEDILVHLERIRNTANKIITHIDPNTLFSCGRQGFWTD